VAILKAGGAYLPLDPAYPQERLAYMLADSGTRVVVTQAGRFEALAAEGLRVVCLDTEAAEIEQKDPGNPRVRSLPESMAYVIYTSGSTGRPKGCVVTHANVVRLFTATEPWYGFDASDVWTLFHSFAFDFSVWELWGALLYGGRLVVVPHGVSRSPDAFRRLLAEEGVTVLSQTPSAFLQLIEADAHADAEQALALKWVIFGGEALQPAKLTEWIQRHGERPRLINMYGITETTVHVTYFPLPAGVVQRPASLIGRPIPDLQLYLLDGYLEPVPIGVPGEIYVGGGGVARGYLHRPGLTAERFVPHPFGEEPGERLYRAGDQARWLPDGTLEFLGRIDQQVKIRGFRIELGEIEAVLLGHTAVREAAVLARTDELGQTRLIAYLVAEGEAPSIESLRAHLAGTLPEYMVPAAYVFLDALPLTPNGKLDRKALPDPEASRQLATAYVAPRNALDETLAGIVAEVLGMERVGIHDDFFALGGDSLKGAVLINRVQERVGEIVHVAALFERPTVADLAGYLREHYPHRIATLLGEEVAAHDTTPSRRLDESDLASLRSVIPPSRLTAQADGHQKNPPVVFVLAPPRSGTTLLRVMLAGHSRLFAPPELELLGFNTLQERQAEFSGSRRFWLEGAIRALMALFDCDAEEAARRMEAYEEEDLTTQQFYRSLQAALDGRLLVDKTPSYTLDIEILRRAEQDFEGARYVHLLRHPQAMIRSFEKAHLDQIFFPYEHPFAPGELAELIWALSHQNTLQFLASVPPERQHLLRFEDLVHDPEGAMRGLCRFLDLPFEDGLLDPYSDTHSRMADGPYAESRALGDVLLREHGAIKPSVADAWKQDPTFHVLGIMTQELARSLGYQDVGPAAASARIEPVDRSGPLPLSFAQERLWFLDQLVPDNPFYNMPGAVRLQGPLDVDSVRQTIQAVVNRHETLRTTFERRDEGPVQLIASELAVDVPLLDMTDVPESKREEGVRSRIVEEAQRPFDLCHGPLLRATLFRLNDNDHILFFALHHIIGDGWSLGVLLQEVGTLYAALARGEDSPIAELPIQYADFAQWQRRWLTGDVFDTQMGYWRQQLADLPVLALPTDRPRPAVLTFRGSTYSTQLPEDLSASLKDLSRQEGLTLFMTLLAGFQALMARYAGQEDIAIGSPIAGRIHSDLEGLIGFFVNTLVLRTDLSGSPSFRELMHRVRDVCHAALEHQDLPFEKLVEELQPQRDLSREALIQVMFQLQAAPLPDVELSDGLTASLVEAPSEATRFDMEVYLREHSGRLHLWVVYSTEIFERSTIERLARHYKNLLQGLAAEPDRPISRLPLLSQDECQYLLCNVNDTASEFSSPQCIQELFEEQAERTPQAVALEFGETELTYTELNARANRLAHHLRSLGVGPEVRVPVYLERGIEFIIGVLAILKAGGAYVPLDPNEPSERLEFLLHDATGPVVVTSRTLRAMLPDVDAEMLCLDEVSLSTSPETNLLTLTVDSSLAYIIYTSGSTGRPKGVSVTHAAIRRLVMQPNYIEITADDRVAQASTTTFDAATFEIWGALLNGARLVGVPRDIMLSPRGLADYLRDRQISTLFVTTALFNVSVHQAPEGIGGLRTLLFGGEAAQPDCVRKALTDGRPRRLLHVYGPTETTTFATWYAVESLDDRAATVPIGRGISETQTYLLDSYLNPVPVNVPGQLYLSGAGLARGYHARPGLTAERFVPHPFSDKPGARLYRTGDLCRWTASGQIEFIGRVDHQVKLRGFRIELGEIEDALRQHPGVREAVVTIREDTPGEKQLIGYLLGDLQYRGPDEPSDEPADEEKATEAGVERWKKVYDRVIYAGLEDEAREEECFNITGWISSYTGQSIGAEAMHEQVEQTVARIRARRPQRILELGCGTGLLLFPLAPGCEAYWGTDFSEVALNYTGRLVEAQGLKGVELRQQTADDFDGIPQGWFDAVVLNSVVQYFPSLDYLLTVLAGAVRCLRPGGFVFLGDVRNLRLLEALQASVALYQAADETDCGDLAAAVAERVATEQELLIDPELFLAVGERLQVLGGVEIQLKRGHHQHELTAFRYDVLLHRDPSRTATPDDVVRLDWRADAVTLEGLETSLAGSRAQRIEVTGVPNARVMKSVYTASLLNAEDRPPTAGQFRAALDSDARVVGIDPEALWQLESEYPYRVAVGWSPVAADCCDVVLSRCDETTPETESRREYLAAPVEWPIAAERPLASYATEPARGTLSRSLVPDVRRHLAGKLPEYMIPAALVVLDQLPLTPSGKLDRRALPAPGGSRPDLARAYVAPRNETEEVLAQILSDVLGIDQVGVHDNFFDLGGHSLLATQAISRVRQRFGIDLPLRAMFEEPNVAHLAGLIATAQIRGAATELPPISRADHTRELPLSFSQERLWFLYQLDPNNPFYHITAAVRIQGPLDVHALRSSLEAVVHRHEALRTTFETVDGRAHQRIHDELAMPLAEGDFSGLPDSEREVAVRHHILEGIREPFDLARGPLVRADLIRVAEDDYVFFWVLHHIIGDGWSLGVALRDLAAFYEAFSTGADPRLADLAVQYADFAVWQRNYLSGEVLEQQLRFWKGQLDGVPETTNLPTDRPRPPVPTFRGDQHLFELSAQLSEGIHALSQAAGTTPFMTLLAGFHALLGRYTGQEQLSVGTPIAGRVLREIEPLIGFFVNTLVMRGDLSGRPTFEELLRGTRERTLAAYAHQDLPFERLVDELQLRRDISRNPLFQVMFALQDAPLPTVRLDHGLTFAPVELNAGTAQFDLSVSIHESAGLFRGSVKYSTDLFDAGTVARFMQHYQRLLEAMTSDPQQRVFEVPLDDSAPDRTPPESEEPAGEFDFAGLGDNL
jgi:amino acid adenylation domain-containing protein